MLAQTLGKSANQDCFTYTVLLTQVRTESCEETEAKTKVTDLQVLTIEGSQAAHHEPAAQNFSHHVCLICRRRSVQLKPKLQVTETAWHRSCCLVHIYQGKFLAQVMSSSAPAQDKRLWCLMHITRQKFDTGHAV